MPKTLMYTLRLSREGYDVDRDGTMMIQTQDGQVYHVAPSQCGVPLAMGRKGGICIAHGKLQCERV